ncbi:MAG: MFS transporter, partial [Candidatus Electrothrix sp.]
GNRAAQMLSTLMTIMTIAPIIGPLLGGQVVALAGWRAVFWFLVAVGLFTLVLLWTIPETLPASRRNTESFRGAMRYYGELLRHRRILGYASTGGFLYAGLFAYVAGTPFIYINYYHVSEQAYGFFWGIVIAGATMAHLLNSRLVIRHGYDRILIVGTVVMALAAFATALAAGTSWGGLWGLVLSLFLFISTLGFIVANSVAGAMSCFPERAGAVSALIGAIHYGSGIIGSALVGLLADGTPWPMGLIIGMTGVGCLLSTSLLLKNTGK